MRFATQPPTPTGNIGGSIDDSAWGSQLGSASTLGGSQHHRRTPTHPFLLSSRQKPRRWPLVLRFVKGAVHGAIIFPVLWHAIFTAVVVVLDKYAFESVGLPSTIIPSLSIVVGLMLVFRNQTSYNRFWDGRNGLQTINTSIRNLVRTITTNAYNSSTGPPTEAERQDIERTIKFLMAIPYAVKNHLRSEWGAAWLWNDSENDDLTRSRTEAGTPGLSGSTSEIRMPPGTEVYDGTHNNKSTYTHESRIDLDDETRSVYNPVYAGLLPVGLQGHEADGLGLPFELTFFVDGFIKRGVTRGWFHPPGASQMQAQLNTLTDAFGKMETIMLTPIPVAHLIHQKQVLALFGCVLPFAMVDDFGWWTIPIVTLVIFTLYGIEGIGSQLEDPFGYDKNDIKMDAICQDLNMELSAIVTEWKRVATYATTQWEVRQHDQRSVDGPSQTQAQTQNGSGSGRTHVAAGDEDHGDHSHPRGKSPGDSQYVPPEMFIRRRHQVYRNATFPSQDRSQSRQVSTAGQ